MGSHIIQPAIDSAQATRHCQLIHHQYTAQHTAATMQANLKSPAVLMTDRESIIIYV